MLSLGSKLLLWKSRYIQRETKRSAQGVSHRGGADVSFLPAYDIVQGSEVFWNPEQPSTPTPPTAVLLHGILGSKRNLFNFARRWTKRFPHWQLLLVDHRCHGESAAEVPELPNTVQSAANDVLRLLQHMRLYPHALVGHSFGGKVALSMLEQFGRRLPRPVQVWILDTVPGEVFAGGSDQNPKRVIETLSSVELPVTRKTELMNKLVDEGFSNDAAAWMTTNLVENEEGFSWSFDLHGIRELYRSYEEVDLWKAVEEPPEGAIIDFVQAEQSAFRWREKDVERIKGAGARVHLLEGAGHWLHAEAPDMLLETMSATLSRRR